LQGENAGFYPSEFNYLIGKKMLFVVDHSSSVVARSDGSYRVRRVCMDPKIIQEFCNGVSGVAVPKVCKF
jgi:serine/threonine-protein kinase RIO1